MKANKLKKIYGTTNDFIFDNIYEGKLSFDFIWKRNPEMKKKTGKWKI